MQCELSSLFERPQRKTHVGIKLVKDVKSRRRKITFRHNKNRLDCVLRGFTKEIKNRRWECQKKRVFREVIKE